MSSYNVFVGAVKDVPPGVRFSRYGERGGKGYLVLFHEAEEIEGFVPVPAEEIKNLPDEDRRFITACKLQLNAEYLRAHKEEMAESLKLFAEAFEKEVEAMTVGRDKE